MMNNSCIAEVSDSGCLSLSGSLTFESTPGLYRETLKLFQPTGRIDAVDLSGITAADSAGLALLLEWQALLHAASRDLEVRNAPEGLLSLARLAEADDVMHMSGRIKRV
jgi:phospholipid transport system transporter-binding protein